jgi:hypothetical protein
MLYIAQAHIYTNKLYIIVAKKKVELLRCHRCSHFWEYSGKNVYVATCPHCRTQLSIKKHRVLQKDLGLVPSGLTAVERISQGEKSCQ